MGRELRRKQAKREGKSLEKPIEKKENSVKSLIKIIMILIFIICAIYLLSALFITKELDWFDKKDENDNIQTTNSILAKQTFMQSDEEYWVYYYDSKKSEDEITDLVSSKLSNDKVYRVDMSSALNSNFLTEEGNRNAKTIDDLKVKVPTLIKISADNIIEYYESDEIKNKLK